MHSLSVWEQTGVLDLAWGPFSRVQVPKTLFPPVRFCSLFCIQTFFWHLFISYSCNATRSYSLWPFQLRSGYCVTLGWKFMKTLQFLSCRDQSEAGKVTHTLWNTRALWDGGITTGQSIKVNSASRNQTGSGITPTLFLLFFLILG